MEKLDCTCPEGLEGDCEECRVRELEDSIEVEELMHLEEWAWGESRGE
jgi:hypothetical protein